MVRRGHEPETADADGVALMAHLCLNALTSLQVGLRCLGDPRIQLASQERDMLVTDVMSGIRRLEALSESLIRGILPAAPVTEAVRAV